MTNHIEFEWLSAGYCTHPEWVVMQGGSFKKTQFPAMVGLIKHPTEGLMLYDTGYGPDFFESTRKWPNRLYSLVTPVHLKASETIRAQLRARGISSQAIRYILISHFHADHMAALSEFPKAQFIYLESAFNAVSHLKGLKAVINGFLPELLPKDFLKRSQTLSLEKNSKKIRDLGNFSESIDIFGDQSIQAIPLPGHVAGQMGLLIQTLKKRFFLVADTCWKREAFENFRMPSRLGLWMQHNQTEYQQTLYSLHELWKEQPDLNILPSHCLA